MKKIVAVMMRDTVPSYSRGPFPFISYVTVSNHPSFVNGVRLDYGFLEVALKQGYTVVIIPPTDEQITQAINEYEAKNGAQDWIDWRPVQPVLPTRSDT